MRTPTRRVLGAVLATVSMVALAACGADTDETDSAGGDGGGEDKSLTIGYIPWDEDIAVTHTWTKILEDEGYDVEMKQLDVAPTFVGLAKGDIDLFFDAWLPTTHSDYWDKYGDQVEDIGVWYDNAKLTIAVPEYVDAKTIADLKGNADTFDGKIVGIEPGAGLTRITKDEAIPTYGLDDYNLLTSSTSAMLSELKKATDNEEPIVVTLWRPHWAYDAFPIRDLEDPEGAMGEAEEIHTLAREGFSEDFPEVTDMLKKFTMDDTQLGSLESLVLREQKDDPEKGVEMWLEDNADFVKSLKG
ncbi:MAG TPA: glycine betaine ABC transporter substrate-binding protein [Nocardioidaceae bacterium]|nr:glycine betaine ABC transporter substrate-binding protein [Nocardioidaceae bacterium]